MGTEIPWECSVWQKITAQLCLSGPVCCDEFAMHKTWLFMANYITDMS